MERWKRAAETEPDERRRSDYAGLALVFADAAGRRQGWAEALKGWNMRQSQQVLEWQQEARVEERRLILSDILLGKFGSLPPDLSPTIQQSTDADALRRWVSAAIKATTLDEFRQSAGI